MPAIRKGDDPRERLAKTRNALFSANSRIGEFDGWYEMVRKSYGGQ